MGNLRLDLQELLHLKEREFIKRIEKYCAANNIEFEDAHDDHKTGVDVIINKLSYDLKVSEHDKLSYWRKTPTGLEYEPHMTHTRIPYLICKNDGKIYKLTKQEFRDYVNSLREQGKLDELTHIHCGDGNENRAVDISHFLDENHLFMELNDNVDRWSTFAHKAV